MRAPRRSERLRFTHMYRRRRQKSRTALAMTDGLAPGRGARRPRVVRHPDLGDRAARGAELDQELRREEGPVRFDVDALERLAAEELAGAVDVGDLEPEEDPVGEPVGARVGGADERVGALDAEADDDVGRVGGGEALGEPPDVGDVELAVAVGERDELVAGRREAGAERGAVPEVRRVVDGAHDVRMAGGEVVGDRRGRVARPVVDRDDLERLGEQRQGRQRLVDQALEVRLLVVGREEVRQPGDAGRVRDARRGQGLGGHGAARRPTTCISNPSSCEVSSSIS